VLETLVQLQTFLPGFQGPSESPSISSTSSQQAGLEDPSLCDTAKQTTGKATAQDSIGTGGRMQITPAPGWPLNPSSAHNQVANALPQSAPVGICNLMQELIRILDQLFHSQLPRMDWTLAPPRYHHLLTLNYLALRNAQCYFAGSRPFCNFCRTQPGTNGVIAMVSVSESVWS